MNKYPLSMQEYTALISSAVKFAIKEGFSYIYGIPRGGTHVAVSMVCSSNGLLKITDSPYGDCTLIVDDIVTTGKTIEPFCKNGHTVLSLLSKMNSDPKKCFTIDRWRKDTWIVFPWERDKKDDGEALVTRMLEYIGEDPNREGLIETPKRVVKAWGEWFSGYGKEPVDVVKVFKGDTSDEMIILRDIEFTSWCEHHMAQFTGRAHVAYIPDGCIIGASKLARIVDLYAKRLQIQERLCNQVTAALEELLKPRGAACLIEAKHSCISSRGVGKQQSVFTTSSLTGIFKTNPATRSEFLHLVKG